jgi:hypothetical protein
MKLIKIKYYITEYSIPFFILMKSVNKVFYILLVISITFISCSNYEDNPLIVKEKIYQQTVKVNTWHKLNFPPRTKTFLAYQANIIFVGTEDGKFYVSNDTGSFWLGSINTINNRAPIKSIDYFRLDNLWNSPRGHAIACSDVAIYYSSDEGRTWSESLVFPNEIEPQEANVVKFTKKYTAKNRLGTATVNIGGKFHKYNKSTGVSEQYNIYYGNIQTQSLVFDKVWTNTSLGDANWNVKSIFEYPVENTTGRSPKPVPSIISYYYGGLSDSVTNYFYFGRMGTVEKYKDIQVLGVNNCALSFAENTNGDLFIGTKNGLYKYIKSLEKLGLNSIEVKFLEMSNLNVLYAGTSNGLLSSADGGLIWKDIGPVQNTPIEYMSLSKDGYLFIKYSSGEYFYIKIEMESLSRLYITPLIYPENNMTGVELNPVFRWSGWENENPSFWLQISTNPGFESPLVYDQRNLKELSYAVKDLQSKTTYYWRVRCETSMYLTDWSYVWSFSTI